MEDEIVLEEGELSHDSEDGYTPLERPANYANTQPMPRLPDVAPQLESEEELQSSDSDSDSDSNDKKRKIPKMRLKPQPQQRDLKTKKYDIWSSRLQEDTLVATLGNCDVEKKERSRDVETYDYTLAHKYYSQEDDNRFRKVERTNNKRTRQDRSNHNFQQRQRTRSSEREYKAEPRDIPDLEIDKSNEAEKIAQDIASKLNEEKVELILKVITVLGKDRAINMFQETRNVEANGGMLIMNQTRRRTSGGVFLNLVRHESHLTTAERDQIFGDERQKYKEIIKQRRKEKILNIQKKVAQERKKILPDLLTRAKLLASQNLDRKVRETEEQEDCVNPPPTPETDCCENSRDGMDGSPVPVINKNDSLESSREKLSAYDDDDFLDLGCGVEMDLF